jgi:hypothetical protein
MRLAKFPPATGMVVFAATATVCACGGGTRGGFLFAPTPRARATTGPGDRLPAAAATPAAAPDSTGTTERRRASLGARPTGEDVPPSAAAAATRTATARSAQTTRHAVLRGRMRRLQRDQPDLPERGVRGPIGTVERRVVRIVERGLVGLQLGFQGA